MGSIDFFFKLLNNKQIMCGISGVCSNTPISEDSLVAMCQAMTHRGPDDEGTWFNTEKTIGLGHRRLAVIDLSPEGHQPMHSRSERYVVVYNGEIYNFESLRKELESKEALSWRGHSDTEVLLACVDIFGPVETLKKLNGMFAIALYDKQEKTLLLARDRMGEKPLYYGVVGDQFYFCSELKSLKAATKGGLTVDKDALTLFTAHGYIPDPLSIYQGIYKLQPGRYLTIDTKAKITPITPDDAIPYWSLESMAEAGHQNRFSGDDDSLLDELDRRLRASIKLRMAADVPLGAFLSGGYDSSLVVAMMQDQSSRPIQTFSIGFDSPGYNEAVHAKAVAETLKTQHTELYLTPQDALDVIPQLSSMYCEPFADSSQVPTHIVSKLAKEQVTVALSGDGGDELFGGYNRYFWTKNIWQKIRLLPKPSRSLIAKGILSQSPEGLNRAFSKLQGLLPSKLNVRLPGDKLHKLAHVLTADSIDDMYYRLILVGQNFRQVLTSPTSISLEQSTQFSVTDPVERMMLSDMRNYLPGDILTKVDRAAMAVSLETRVPFLDHEIVEFSQQIPLSAKIRNQSGKWCLKTLAHRYIPKELMERPKMGFGVPIHDWLRGPLKDWGNDLLTESQLKAGGHYDPAAVQKIWSEHLSGERNHVHQLWTILMFQDWFVNQ